MKATPLIINWHHENNPYPIYSAHFEPGGKGRLATAAGDNNVRVRNLPCPSLTRLRLRARTDCYVCGSYGE